MTRRSAATAKAQVRLRDLDRRARLPRVRLDHGAERGLLQVPELRGDERV